MQAFFERDIDVCGLVVFQDRISAKCVYKYVYEHLFYCDFERTKRGTVYSLFSDHVGDHVGVDYELSLFQDYAQPMHAVWRSLFQDYAQPMRAVWLSLFQDYAQPMLDDWFSLFHGYT